MSLYVFTCHFSLAIPSIQLLEAEHESFITCCFSLLNQRLVPVGILLIFSGCDNAGLSNEI